MFRRLAMTLLAAALVLAGLGAAKACGPEIEIRFIDADGDIFVVTNRSEGPWSLRSLAIRLTGSLGGLVFDTADGGAGANMATPFAAVAGEVELVGEPVVEDGAEAVRLRFRDFPPGRTFMFVIDVDDRLERSEFGRAVISGAEIQGAGADGLLVGPGSAKAKAEGRFGVDGRARLRGGLCT